MMMTAGSDSIVLCAQRQLTMTAATQGNYVIARTLAGAPCWRINGPFLLVCGHMCLVFFVQPCSCWFFVFSFFPLFPPFVHCALSCPGLSLSRLLTTWTHVPVGHSLNGPARLLVHRSKTENRVSTALVLCCILCYAHSSRVCIFFSLCRVHCACFFTSPSLVWVLFLTFISPLRTIQFFILYSKTSLLLYFFPLTLSRPLENTPVRNRSNVSSKDAQGCSVASITWSNILRPTPKGPMASPLWK